MSSISVSQWMEWMEWVAVRGSVGPARDDIHLRLLASLLGASTGSDVWLTDFMPWTKTAPEPDPADADEEDE